MRYFDLEPVPEPETKGHAMTAQPERISKNLKPVTRSWSWRAEAGQSIRRLGNDLDQLQLTDEPAAIQLMERLNTVVAGINKDWDVEETWQSLHQIEEDIAQLAKGSLFTRYISVAVAHADAPGVGDSQVFKAIKTRWGNVSKAAAQKSGTVNDTDSKLREDLVFVIRQAHSNTDSRHQAANDAGRRLTWAALSLLTLAILIGLAAWLLDDLRFLVALDQFKGQNAAQVSDWQVVLLVALGGLVGGSFGAFPAFTNEESDRYRLANAKAASRLALGVLAAFVGVSLVGAGWVSDLTSDSAPALFAVALAFGLSQERASKILEDKISSNPKEREKEPTS